MATMTHGGSEPRRRHVYSAAVLDGQVPSTAGLNADVARAVSTPRSRLPAANALAIWHVETLPDTCISRLCEGKVLNPCLGHLLQSAPSHFLLRPIHLTPWDSPHASRANAMRNTTGTPPVLHNPRPVTYRRGVLRKKSYSISSSWLIASILQGKHERCYERPLFDMHRFPALQIRFQFCIAGECPCRGEARKTLLSASKG